MKKNSRKKPARRLTADQTESFLFKTLSKNKPLTKQERERLIPLMLAGDENARNKLVTSHARLILKIASKHVISLHSLTYKDLVMEALAEITAHLHKFDPKRGALSTFVGLRARTGILRAINFSDKMVHVPTQEVRRANGALPPGIKYKRDIRISETIHSHRPTDLYGSIMPGSDKKFLESIDVRRYPDAEDYDIERPDESLMKHKQVKILRKAFRQLSKFDQFLLKSKLFDEDVLNKTSQKVLKKFGLGTKKPDGRIVPLTRQAIQFRMANAQKHLKLIVENLLNSKAH